MYTINQYETFEEKKEFFNNNQKNPFIIDTINQFDNWYNLQIAKRKHLEIYRGMSEAKYMLYNSAQRYWILNDLQNWKGKENIGYLRMIEFMLDRGKNNPLFQKVFEFYKLKGREIDFPLMSILQHYGAPTPLIDWTYNIDISLYFATENNFSKGNNGDMSNYFSIYSIRKKDNSSFQFINIKGSSSARIPELKDYRHHMDKKNEIYYLSDFEDHKIAKKKKEINLFTSIYNQNIIPQEGILIFNPFPYMPFEHYFETGSFDKRKKPIRCINIHKKISEYIRRRLKKRGITKEYIYPDLKNDAKQTINRYLDDIAKGS